MSTPEPDVVVPQPRGAYGPKVWHRDRLAGLHADLTLTDRPDSNLKSTGEGLLELPGRAGSEEPDIVRLPAKDVWDRILEQYHRRRVAEARRAATESDLKGPAVPGQQNWSSLGPSMMLNGQALGFPPMGGRVAGLAVAPGGRRLYAATANGGVFMSEDAGLKWRSLMDNFDLDPTYHASTSLCCGAIALHPSNPDRVYVGTGEGAVYDVASGSIRSGWNTPAYRGIGPITGSRGPGGTYRWERERIAPQSPKLAGEAFFQMAADPQNGDIVWAATTVGLYRRAIAADGKPLWTRKLAGYFTSVIAVATPEGTVFYAAGRDVNMRLKPGVPEKGYAAIASIRGEQVSWVQLVEIGPPRTGPLSPDELARFVTRLSLAVSPAAPTRLYVLKADADDNLKSVEMVSLQSKPGKPAEMQWHTQRIGGIAGDLIEGQASYNLSIAADPADASFIYVGRAGHSEFPHGGVIFRYEIVPGQDGGPVAVGFSIGRHAHADIHALVHTPGNPGELWAATDGGVFLNRKPREMEAFEARNDGLACLCSTFIDQHPTDRNIMITGLQDNGTAYRAGGPQWTRIGLGDGGYCAFNWADPQKVAFFMNGQIYFSEGGGASEESFVPSAVIGWQNIGNSWIPPIVTTPFDPANRASADTLAAATKHWTADGTRYSAVVVSRDFGRTWPARGNDDGFVSTDEVVVLPNDSTIFVVAFASATRMVIATRRAEVYISDYRTSERKWGPPARVDNVAAAPLLARGAITDIGIDWADAKRRSFYVSFAGTAASDHRRVWHFDGASWTARSGSRFEADDALLDVEHNAIAVDPRAPNNVYVGADIGVWHSSDRGKTWRPLPNGLPDAAVYDLRIHPTLPLLRAALYGRGVYEWDLEPPAVA